MSFAIETSGDYSGCTTASQCTYTLLRLTFFDGDGFDFAYYLAQNYRFLFGVSLLFVCITSFGIMNGLVGIFGRLFNQASMEAFQSSGDDIGEEDEGSHDEHSYRRTDVSAANDRQHDFVKLARSRLTVMGFTGNALRYAVSELQCNEDRRNGEDESDDDQKADDQVTRRTSAKVYVDSEQGRPPPALSGGSGAAGRRHSLIQQLVGVRPTIASMQVDETSHTKLDTILACVQSLQDDSNHSKRMLQDLFGIAEMLRLQQHRMKKLMLSRRRRPYRTSRRTSRTIATLEPIVLLGLDPIEGRGLQDSSQADRRDPSSRKLEEQTAS